MKVSLNYALKIYRFVNEKNLNKKSLSRRFLLKSQMLSKNIVNYDLLIVEFKLIII